jgi:hypothetical protein
MLYYGNVREDGRVIQPHELVFDYYTLNGLTGFLYCKHFTLNVPIDESPIDFVTRFDGYTYVFVIYNDYTMLYKFDRENKFIKSKNIGRYMHRRCIVKNDDLVLLINGEKVLLSGFANKCKQFVHHYYLTGENNEDPIIVYIDHNNVVHNADKYYILLDRFIIIKSLYNHLSMYDIEKHILFEAGGFLFSNFKLLKDQIIDMKVYRENIELYTNKGNYYIFWPETMGEGESCFIKLSDGWSVKPTFNRCKSAKKID